MTSLKAISGEIWRSNSWPPMKILSLSSQSHPDHWLFTGFLLLSSVCSSTVRHTRPNIPATLPEEVCNSHLVTDSPDKNLAGETVLGQGCDRSGCHHGSPEVTHQGLGSCCCTGTENRKKIWQGILAYFRTVTNISLCRTVCIDFTQTGSGVFNVG